MRVVWLLVGPLRCSALSGRPDQAVLLLKVDPRTCAVMVRAGDVSNVWTWTLKSMIALWVQAAVAFVTTALCGRPDQTAVVTLRVGPSVALLRLCRPGPSGPPRSDRPTRGPPRLTGRQSDGLAPPEDSMPSLGTLKVDPREDHLVSGVMT